MISLAKGIKWAGLSQGGRLLLQLVSVIILARFLAPKDYGIMAIVLIIMSAGQIIKDMGTGASILQRRDLDGPLVNAIFFLNIAIGFVLAMSVAMFSGRIAILLGSPEAVGVILSSSPLLILGGLATVHQKLLERQERFETLAKIELSASAVGLVAAVIVAYQTRSAYAFVIQLYAAGTLSVLLLWRHNSWRPMRKVNWRRLGEVYEFSVNLFVFQIVNYFQRNADTMIISKVLGASSLGQYNMAHRLVLFPIQSLASVLGRVMVPAYSQSDKSLSDLSMHYLMTVRTVISVLGPLLGAIWVLRDRMVALLLGEQWLQVSEVLTWIIPLGYLQVVMSTTGSIFIFRGRTDLLRNIGVVASVAVVSALIVAAPYGLECVAKTYFLVMFVIFWCVIWLVMRVLDQSIWKAASMIMFPTVISLTVTYVGVSLGIDDKSSGYINLVEIVYFVGALILSGALFVLGRAKVS